MFGYIMIAILSLLSGKLFILYLVCLSLTIKSICCTSLKITCRDFYFNVEKYLKPYVCLQLHVD